MQALLIYEVNFNPERSSDAQAELGEGTLSVQQARKVDIRLPGKGDSNSHGARPVHQKHRWTRTSRLSIKNSPSIGSAPRSGTPRVFSGS